MAENTDRTDSSRGQAPQHNGWRRLMKLSALPSRHRLHSPTPWEQIEGWATSRETPWSVRSLVADVQWSWKVEMLQRGENWRKIYLRKSSIQVQKLCNGKAWNWCQTKSKLSVVNDDTQVSEIRHKRQLKSDSCCNKVKSCRQLSTRGRKMKERVSISFLFPCQQIH